MDNQQAEWSATPEAQTRSSTLALLFFAMGVLHIYGMMRSHSKRTLLPENGTIISSLRLSHYMTVGLVVAALALIKSILIF